MMRSASILLGVSLLTTTILSQQRPQSVPTLGESRSEVLLAVGSPHSIYAPRLEQFYEPSERDTVRANTYPVVDVYNMTFGGEEFELKVLYRLDSSTSRLHPVERVGGITITPDKKEPFSAILEKLPWTGRLCAGGCSLLGTAFHSYEVTLYQSNPSNGDIALATSIFGGYAAVDPKYTPRLAMEIDFVEKPPAGATSIPKFNDLTVDQIRIGTTDPVFTKSFAQGLFRETPYIP